MRTFITLYIALTAISSSIKAQIDSAFLKTLDSTVRRYQNTGTVYYADKLEDNAIKSSIKAFSKNKIVSDYKTPTIDSIILTNRELTFIKKSLNELQSFYWPDSVIKNSKKIRSDSLISFVSRQQRHALD